jgi:hypothetical protein
MGLRINRFSVATAAGLLVLALAFASFASPAASALPRSGQPQARHAVPAWLATINLYRTAAGLPAVRDRPAWDLGLEHHLAYLRSTPSQYLTGRYQSSHTENPLSPYYSADGAAEAGYSDLIQGAAFTPLQAVRAWLTAPFHAIGMLRAQLRNVALVDDPLTGDAGLDVIQGLNYKLPAATAPILFPGPGSKTDLLTFGGEHPDPLETCGWQQSPVTGLPLIIMLQRAPGRAVRASVTGPTGTESTANRRLCVVDEHTYHSADPVYGPTARVILSDDHAIILIPRDPLAPGRYSVRVRGHGTPDIRWTFSAYAPAPAVTG